MITNYEQTSKITDCIFFESQEKKPFITQHWLTAFTQEALDFGVRERMIFLNKKLENVIDLKEIKIPNDKTYTYVGWDEGRISDVEKELLLYSTEFTSCIAVLARAFKKNSDKASHIALHHVFLKPKNFSETLSMLERVIKAGTIEFFISSGLKSTENNKEEIYIIINEFSKKYINIEFKIIEDIFGICDLGEPNKVIEGIPYPETCGLDYAGFDELQRPFQVIGVTCDRGGDKGPIEEIIWLEDE